MAAPLGRAAFRQGLLRLHGGGVCGGTIDGQHGCLCDGDGPGTHESGDDSIAGPVGFRLRPSSDLLRRLCPASM